MEKVAICITTRNRPESFARVYESCIKYGYKVFVVDDASDEPYCKADYRFNERVGIPRSKNKCIELAMDYGAVHIFLLDDDCIPMMPHSFESYINSDLNHACYTFDYKGFNRKTQMHYGDVEYMSYPLVNGCMMYYTCDCFIKVGGFDIEYGLGKYEHIDHSRRLYNAGLTPARFIDIKDNVGLFDCLDDGNRIERSFTQYEMSSLLQQGKKKFMQTFASKEFKPYI